MTPCYTPNSKVRYEFSFYYFISDLLLSMHAPCLVPIGIWVCNSLCMLGQKLWRSEILPYSQANELARHCFTDIYWQTSPDFLFRETAKSIRLKMPSTVSQFPQGNWMRVRCFPAHAVGCTREEEPCRLLSFWERKEKRREGREGRKVLILECKQVSQVEAIQTHSFWEFELCRTQEIYNDLSPETNAKIY